MEIKTVSVDKLFSLGNYNNERISLTADISKGESAEGVVAQLFLKITSIEDVFSMYRIDLNEFYSRGFYRFFFVKPKTSLVDEPKKEGE